jgi:chemotaxis protein MotB
VARKKALPAPENHERWLISYADFITLLFAFFVVMFASSQTDKSKAQQVSDSVKSALEQGATKPVVREILGGTVDDSGKGSAMMRGPGGSQKVVTPNVDVPPSKVSVTDLTPSMSFLTRALAAEIKQGKIDVHLNSQGLVVSLRQAAFFPSGGDEIPDSAYPSLQKIASTIADLPNPVRFEGHTDSIPIHNEHYKSNWELSAARSIAMMALLSDKYGLPRSRFTIAGFAETSPVATNETAEGRTRNRRVDIVILNQQVIVKAEGGTGGQAVDEPAPPSAK